MIETKFGVIYAEKVDDDLVVVSSEFTYEGKLYSIIGEMYEEDGKWEWDNEGVYRELESGVTENVDSLEFYQMVLDEILTCYLKSKTKDDA